MTAQPQEDDMRKLIMGFAAAAALLSPLAATSASARPYGYDNHRVRQEMRECRRELRHADSRREYARERRECAREISRARRDSWRDRRDWRRDRYDRYGRRW
jgi:hypothetical protein